MLNIATNATFARVKSLVTFKCQAVRVADPGPASELLIQLLLSGYLRHLSLEPDVQLLTHFQVHSQFISVHFHTISVHSQIISVHKFLHSCSLFIKGDSQLILSSFWFILI
jgi:hypothetical protein